MIYYRGCAFMEKSVTLFPKRHLPLGLQKASQEAKTFEEFPSAFQSPLFALCFWCRGFWCWLRLPPTAFFPLVAKRPSLRQKIKRPHTHRSRWKEKHIRLALAPSMAFIHSNAKSAVFMHEVWREEAWSTLQTECLIRNMIYNIVSGIV